MSDKPTEPHPMFEVFGDSSYYDLWCLRRLGARSFEDTLHFNNRDLAVHASYVVARWMEVDNIKK